MSKFDIILIDLPHAYSDKALAGDRGAGCKYPTLTLNEANALPINDVAADNAMLFFWGTWPLIEQHFETIKAYGFKFKTIGFSWTKSNPKSGTPFIGMGSYTRSNNEFCLLALKGKVKPSEWIVDRSVSSAIVSPRLSHSEKPPEAIERIERLVGPDRSKLELFARSTREGWTSLGNELDGRDIRESLPELIAKEDEDD